MIERLIIFGAGSIGNHYAFAAKQLDLKVEVFDIDPRALTRIGGNLSSKVWGWDKSIKLKRKPNFLKDLVLIGTPPEYRTEILESNLKNGAKIF